MQKFLRTVLSVVASFGLLGTLAISTSAPAADTGAASNDVASLRLAAVTAPTLALDAAALADRENFANDSADGIQQAPATLEALVDAQETADTVDAEQKCLAASVYFEAKGEPLGGQLAVAETVLNRAHSGRFPTSICGVVRQKGQFSFVRRGGKIPAPVTTSKSWRQAVAIARIAQGELWEDIAPNALFFHARRISMNMGSATRVAQVGNHIFYR
ncbi:cell wall hydrolase [Sphingomonas quercus]|uniref:cell wall hydrolase n=1 Tax=Sphingomonas quercus TaxID=2842451 RepID=UPI00209AED30|nr:cell wall hydrolase [Sphingomonas quercus]